MTTSIEERAAVFKYCETMLGGGLIDIDLSAEQYELALDRALTRFRQRSSNSVEESYSFLELIPDQNEYRLPDEIIEVQSVFRRTIGSRTGMGAGGSLMEPFAAAYTSSYLLTGGLSGGHGGLATYYMFAGFQELIGQMFGSFIEFKWKPQTHILTILQRPYGEGEQILLKTHNYRPDFALLTDIYAKQWLRDYTLATCKMILGEARSLFQSIAGPSGSISLNGSDLKASAKEDMERLDKELDMYMAGGGGGYTFVIG